MGMNLDGIEPKTASVDLVYDPFTPIDKIVPDVWVTVLNIGSHYV